jgi:hypothetical protein
LIDLLEPFLGFFGSASGTGFYRPSRFSLGCVGLVGGWSWVVCRSGGLCRFSVGVMGAWADGGDGVRNRIDLGVRCV